MMNAAVVMCRDENAYLHEWCAWHLALGFDRLLVVDDQSRIPVTETISTWPAPLRSATQVLVPMVAHNRQRWAYLGTIENLGHCYQWMAFLDCDEFIVPRQDNNIQELLNRYKDYGALVINWQVFGASGREDRQGSQIDTLTMRAERDHPINHHVKSIVQPSKVAHVLPASPHHFHYIDGCFAVNEQYVPVTGPLAPPHTDIVQMNHYYTRSRKEWAHKCARGYPDGTPSRSLEAFDLHDPEFSKVEDLAAVQLKTRMVP